MICAGTGAGWVTGSGAMTDTGAGAGAGTGTDRGNLYRRWLNGLRPAGLGLDDLGLDDLGLLAKRGHYRYGFRNNLNLVIRCRLQGRLLAHYRFYRLGCRLANVRLTFYRLRWR